MARVAGVCSDASVHAALLSSGRNGHLYNLAAARDEAAMELPPPHPATDSKDIWMIIWLDQASTGTEDTSSLCGFVWSLSVWMWEWLPVGHPVFKNPDKPNHNPHEGLHDQDPYHCPTISYCWDQVSVYIGSSHVRYKCYVNELDTLTAEQVFWQPYENDRDFFINDIPCCQAIWKIARYSNEERKETITKLHRFSRRNNQDISDWANKHNHWIVMWNQRETLVESENRPHNNSTDQKYLVWYGQRYRLKVKPGWTQEEWSELVSEDPSVAEGYHAFNMVVRETVGSQVDYAPMHDELGREFLMCVNDANVALSHPPTGALSKRTLRSTLEFKARFHKWAAMLSCHGAQSMDEFTAGTSRSSRDRRRHLTIDDTEEEEQIQEE
ncbi:hypothetical protein D1007_62135 [Hordeum vulgare]|nr:hypothetical protein D1007_62135 [Hordeum vulgare]